MIIGITGTMGAGKGTVVDCLEGKGYEHISARKIWTQELEARNLPVDRDSMTALANQLRAEKGPDYFVRRALKEVKPGQDVVIESIRTVAEAELLKSQGGVLLAVDADKKLRYSRISGRGSALDDVSYKDFVRQEDAEMANKDPNKQNIAKVAACSDYVVMNNGTLEELHTQVDIFLEKLS